MSLIGTLTLISFYEWCELSSGDGTRGVDVATIGMVDLTVDGVALFPGAVAPPEPVYTAGHSDHESKYESK